MLENGAAALSWAVGLLAMGFLGRGGRPGNDGEAEPYYGREPQVRVLAAEFIQVPRSTASGVVFEPAMDFRVSLCNMGLGRAVDLRCEVGDEGDRPFWSSLESLDVEGGGGDREVILRSVRIPPVGPGQFTWIEVPLRVGYRDEQGREWFTRVPLRLKIMRHAASESYSCWWVDVMAPEKYGMRAER